MSADNEITREQNSIDRIAVFKKRTTDFFADYENPNGSEDALEICLICDGRRAVSQAEEIINRQQAEIEEYQKHIDNDIIYVKNIKAEAVKELAEKTNKMITEIYNKHVFGNNDFEAEEKDAIINFSDDITYGFNNLVKEMAGEG